MESNVLQLLSQATITVQLVIGLLVCMSIGSWSIMLQKFFSFRKAHKKIDAGLANFAAAPNLRAAVQSLGSDTNSPLYHVAQEGVTEFNKLRATSSSERDVVDNVRRALRLGVSVQLAKLSAALSFLATCANAAPFIGLFGTVWGIMNSFHNIGLMKTASLAAVAPGISEALIATAIGLAVAIPATIGYNYFLGRLGALETELVNFAGMFLNSVQRELHAKTAA